MANPNDDLVSIAVPRLAAQVTAEVLQTTDRLQSSTSKYWASFAQFALEEAVKQPPPDEATEAEPDPEPTE